MEGRSQNHSNTNQFQIEIGCNGEVRTIPAIYLSEILQPQHSINTSTNPEGCHMSNFIRQNEVNMANEPLKVDKPLLESSSEMD